MALKKSELYSSLWASCDELRGGMDASQYKDYVLVLLFVKYVSDKAASQKGYLLDVPKGGSFADMVALNGDKEIGDKMNKIIARLAEANDLKGVIDVADFNDADKLGKGKEMVDRLSNLVSIFSNPALDFRSNRAEGDDILGDAYEYLMRHFATESGKSKGQFYTPAEVSRIMARVIGIGSATSASQTIYDPTCGSGSLLLKAHDEAKGATGHDLALYGQEMDNATKALARMNMILHDCPTAEIWQDNTLSTPHFKDARTGQLKTFDFAVANPPFSTKAWSNGFDPANDLFHRFTFGIPPQKNGDYAFLLHILASLKSNGKGAVILPHGVLFRGAAEAAIRKEIVRRGYIKGIIGLPANLFYGTGIPACIIVLDKENATARKGIFMIDASKGCLKDGNKNRLRSQDIHRIVDTFTRLDESDPRYARMVSVAEIGDAKNDFNLNLPRYIDSTEPEDLQDIDAHLRGGIPNRDIDALENFWQVFPAVRAALFKKADRPGYTQLRVPIGEVKAAIFGHAEFTAYNDSATRLFAKWKTANTPRLKGIAKGGKPKALIETLSEDLLATIAASVQGELDRVSQTLTGRIRQLAERYATPLPQITDEVTTLAARVDGHLKKIGGGMDVKPGYKHTEVGVIPEEWDAGRLGDKATKVGSGITPTGGERVYKHEGRPFLRSQNVGWGNLILDDIAFIDDQTHTTFQDTEIEPDDVFLNITGASIGRSAVADTRVLRGNLNQHVCIIRTNPHQLHPRFLNFFLLSSAGQSQIDSFQAGGNRQGLNFGQIRSFLLPVPPLPEQRAIATALSDVDALLGALDRLIAKKRDLKQAAMQQLLTGQTRLPGFHGAWESKRLDELGVLKGGMTPSMQNPSYWIGGNVPWISSGDVKSVLLTQTAFSVTRLAVKQGTTCLIPTNSIVLVMRSGILRKYLPVAMNVIPMAINQDIKALIPTAQCCPQFLLHALIGNGDQILARCLKAGTTVESIELRWLKAFTIQLPPKPEQTAIAEVLSDMDAELAALEQRRAKTRALKQGMMQELLTGRIRLVEG